MLNLAILSYAYSKTMDAAMPPLRVKDSCEKRRPSTKNKEVLFYKTLSTKKERAIVKSSPKPNPCGPRRIPKKILFSIVLGYGGDSILLHTFYQINKNNLNISLRYFPAFSLFRELVKTRNWLCCTIAPNPLYFDLKRRKKSQIKFKGI